MRTKPSGIERLGDVPEHWEVKRIKFQLGLRQLIEDLMVQRLSDNDKIVTRCMDDKEFSTAAFATVKSDL